jgi:beta-xylosidase
MDSALGRWGDQHNGSFVNPVLPGDFSDLDAIRVGEDFYAISSTMQYSPGMLVLHSRDLVNWQIAGHVVQDLTGMDPELGSERMNRDGRGIWAGSIRHHAGRFWVYFGTPDGGIYYSTADRAEGHWSVPRLILKGEGWDDPCPFWDDDGRGYLVATRFGADAEDQKYRIHLFSMTPDGDGVLAASDRVLHQSRGSEANKMYKVDGFYLHYFSEVRPEGRVAMMERSKSLDGPWEVRQLNHVQGAVDKEPNQGGLIQLKDGHWWFLTHQGKGDWEGRAGVLLPVTWIDGWPIPGKPGSDGVGEMVWGGVKPLPSKLPSRLFVDDNFRERALLPSWEWRYQPRPDKWLLTGRSLRMWAFAPLDKKGFSGVRNVLTQRSARTRASEVTVQMDLGGFVNGQEGGLAHFAKTDCRLAIAQHGRERRLVRIDQESTTEGPVLSVSTIWLRSTWTVDGLARFSYSVDDARFTEFGTACRLSWGAYRGDRIGLYTFTDNGEKGYVDFRNFQYRLQ